MGARETFLALAVVLLMSLNLIFQKIAVDYLSVYLIGFLRASLVIPVLFLFGKPPERLWRHALCGFFLVALYLILFGYGLKTDIAANLSAFVLQFQVFFVILCCFLFLGEKPQPYQTLGIVIACGGVYFLHSHSTPDELPLLGVTLLIASCFSHGVGVAMSKMFKLGNSIRDVAWLTALSSPILLASCLAFDGPQATFESIVTMPMIALFCVLFATFACTLWGAYIWLGLIHKLSGATVVPFMLLVPIFSGIISFFVFDETLTAQQMISGSIIVIGVMIAQGLYKHLAPLSLWLQGKARL